MKYCFKHLLITVIPILMLLKLSAASYADTLIKMIDLPDTRVGRIMAGIEIDEYWIVDRGKGLRCLEYQQGVWICSALYGDHLYDAVGPDAEGMIYCDFYDFDTGSGVYIFDASQRTVAQTTVLGPDYPLCGMSISNDDDYLYVLGCDWPRLGVPGGSIIDSGAHRESGILWKIDLSTFNVTEQISVPALPETIFYMPSPVDDDRLFISTQEVILWGNSAGAVIDIRNPGPGMPRETVFVTPSLWIRTHSRYDFFLWSPDEPLVALCSEVDELSDDPDFKAGLWIVDGVTGEVIDRITLLDSSQQPMGVRHGCVSDVYPGRAYVSVSRSGPDNLYAIDMDTGEIISAIPTVEDFLAEFIYETPDGLLIVTGGDSKILIIDPEG